MEDLEEAVVKINAYLDHIKNIENLDKKKQKIGKGHKKLAELNQKLGYGVQAIKHLEQLLHIAFEDSHKEGQAEAALKLGLLNYEQGLLQLSVSYLQKHFELAK